MGIRKEIKPSQENKNVPLFKEGMPRKIYAKDNSISIKLERQELCCISKLTVKEIWYMLKAIGKSSSEQLCLTHGRKICFNGSRNSLVRDSAVGLDGHFT